MLRFAHGWEMRLRWWAVVNPGCEEKRGLPYCRLRDTVLRSLHGSGCITKRIEERFLSLTPVPGEKGEVDRSALDADAMAPRMSLVGPQIRTQQLCYADQRASTVVEQHASMSGPGGHVVAPVEGNGGDKAEQPGGEQTPPKQCEPQVNAPTNLRPYKLDSISALSAVCRPIPPPSTPRHATPRHIISRSRA